MPASGGRALAFRSRDYVVNIRRRRFTSAGVMLMGGHPGRLPRALNNRENQFAILIAQHNLRAQKIRAAEIAAPQIGAMAALATDAVKCFAALYQRGIGPADAVARGKWPKPDFPGFAPPDVSA